jgi:hypothetical protein
MIYMFGAGSISFLVVGILWLLSVITHRPIFGDKSEQFTHAQEGKKDILDEEQAAITAATWTVLNPPS